MAQDNVTKAKAKHEQRQAGRDATLQKQRSGSVGSKLNDSTARAARGGKRRNS
ncbi:MAG: hypothetical protein ACREF9_04315 [Opitutaceae bacterium]